MATKKIDPDSPELDVGHQRGKKIKKGPVVALIGLVSLVLIGTIYAALKRPAVDPDTGLKHLNIDPANISRAIPDSIKNSASDYGGLDYPDPPKPAVPKLGPKLPGDMGAFVKPAPQQKVLTSAEQFAIKLKERKRRIYIEDLDRARTKKLAKEDRLHARKVSAEENRYQRKVAADDNSYNGQQEAIGGKLFFKAGDGSSKGNPLASGVQLASLNGKPSFPANPFDAGLPHNRGTTDNQQTSQGHSRYGNSASGHSGADGFEQNRQGHKSHFLETAGQGGDNYVKASLQAPKSPYEVKAGTIIPTVLLTGINSDLPGMITAQVREQVFDTTTGKYLLIPQGTKVIGKYDSNVSYGQERALVVWSRLIFPNGYSIDLSGMPGVDSGGYAGYSDQVDNHYGKLIGGVILSSLLAGTAESVNYDSDSFSGAFARKSGEEINRAGQAITRKNLNIQPTIKIRPGYSVNIMVNKDLILTPYSE